MNAAPPAADPVPIPVLRPRLPAAETILPYLRRIDESRIYSNAGPLVQELEARLAAHFASADLGVVSATSGFSALVASILATAGRATPERPFALLPSYTFIATASAAEQCGYVPLLADIDEETWQLDPETCVQHPQFARVGVVLPVAPFGRPVPMAPWLAFRARTGVPVAIDGAACFDRIEDDPARFTGDIPLALSFHATKSFACGEGGAVLCHDEGVLRRAATSLNFGFYGTRECLSANLNGKMGEYSAAVAHAELDGWPEKRAALQAVAAAYRRRFEEAGIAAGLRGAPVVSGAYVLYDGGSEASVERIVAALGADRIDFRRWYGAGLHRQPYYADAMRGELPVTDRLAPRLLGLPFAPDFDEASIARVASAIAQAA